MLNGLHYDAGRAAAGLAGAFVLSAGAAATVLLVAEAVRRVVAKAYDSTVGFDPKTSVKNSQIAFLFPYSGYDNAKLASTAAMSFFASLAGMFVLNKFCPSVVTNANRLVGCVAPLKFTADIPILNLFNRFYRY